MSDLILIDTFSGFITVCLGFLFFYWVWQQYVIDSTRQQLFELRDALFDLASEGGISRDSETYQILRKMFNTNIRFAHDLDWVHIAFYLFFALRKRGEILRSALQVEHLIKEIPDEHARRRVEKIVRQLHAITAWHLIRRSLVLMLLLPFAFIISFFFMASTNAITRIFKKFGIILDAKTYSEATS